MSRVVNASSVRYEKSFATVSLLSHFVNLLLLLYYIPGCTPVAYCLVPLPHQSTAIEIHNHTTNDKIKFAKAIAKTVLCAAALVVRTALALEPGVANTTVTDVPLVDNTTLDITTTDNTTAHLTITYGVNVGDKEDTLGVSIDLDDDGKPVTTTCKYSVLDLFVAPTKQTAGLIASVEKERSERAMHGSDVNEPLACHLA